MPPNVFIIGPQCTGKTTLVLQLEKLLTKYTNITTTQPFIIHEVVRQIMSTKHFSADDFSTNRWIELQDLTIKAQIDAEEALEKHWFISDRSVLDPVVYTQLYTESLGKLREAEGWVASVQRMRDGVVILCEAGQRAWLSSDAVRIAFANTEQWEAMNEQFKELLGGEDIPYHLLSRHVVSIEERVEFVVERLLRPCSM